jgi:hypothetical protein
MSHERRHGSGPQGFPLGDEVAKRLAKLRVDPQTGVEHFDGVEGLLPGTLSSQPSQKLL